jgi:hypothetical protein
MDILVDRARELARMSLVFGDVLTRWGGCYREWRVLGRQTPVPSEDKDSWRRQGS